MTIRLSIELGVFGHLIFYGVYTLFQAVTQFLFQPCIISLTTLLVTCVDVFTAVIYTPKAMVQAELIVNRALTDRSSQNLQLNYHHVITSENIVCLWCACLHLCIHVSRSRTITKTACMHCHI